MKVTGICSSGDFWPNKFEECPTVRLDGVDAEHVCAADDVLGYVESYQVNAFGSLCRCECGQRWIVRLDFGRVEIIGERGLHQ